MERQLPPPPPPKKDTLFTFHDNSVLRTMKILDVLKIPIWEGNRILDEEHKNAIETQIKENVQCLDLKPYHIVSYPSVDELNQPSIAYRIVDGQHRVCILRSYYARNPTMQNFHVLVNEKRCESLDEVVEYFKILNHTKSIIWSGDKQLIAMNIINQLINYFKNQNSALQKNFKMGRTVKPFLDIYELRDVLTNYPLDTLQEFDVEIFCKNTFAYNKTLLNNIVVKQKKQAYEDKALKLGFALALEKPSKWVYNVLRE